MPPASFIASHFATKAEYDLSLTMPPTEREAAERKALESREAPASLTCVAEGKRTASFEYGTSSPQDVACLATIVRVLLSYPKFARFCIDTMQAQPTPKKLVELLPELAIRFDLQREGVAVNEAFFKSMAQKLELRELSGVSALAEAEVDPQAEPLISGALTQLHREWSAEGEAERRMSMDPIAQALERFVPVPATASGDAASAPKVVVPGAGLGRGVWELALRGYDVLGLDRALMFVVISRFIFDELIASGRALPICPHLHEFVGPTNVVKADHLSRRILIPDADVLARARAASDPAGSDPAYLQRMVMRAASFEEVAKSPGGLGAFDAVSACWLPECPRPLCARWLKAPLMPLSPPVRCSDRLLHRRLRQSLGGDRVGLQGAQAGRRVDQRWSSGV